MPSTLVSTYSCGSSDKPPGRGKKGGKCQEYPSFVEYFLLPGKLGFLGENMRKGKKGRRKIHFLPVPDLPYHCPRKDPFAIDGKGGDSFRREDKASLSNAYRARTDRKTGEKKEKENKSRRNPSVLAIDLFSLGGEEEEEEPPLQSIHRERKRREEYGKRGKECG